MPICGQSITSLNLSQGSIDCQFNANALPINVNALHQYVANPKTEYHKGKVLNFFQSPQSMSIGIVYNFGGLADFHRIGRLEKIGRDWLSLPSPCQAANAMPMRQSGTNPMPIESPFWIGDISPIHGASRSILRNTNTNMVPIQAQTKTLYVVNPIPICHQSAANPLSMPGHLAMLGRHSIANPSSIQCQSIVIRCQSNVDQATI